MKRLGRLVLIAGMFAAVLAVAWGCGREVPTQPGQSSALHLKSEVWHEAGLYAYSLEDRLDETAICAIRIAVADGEGNYRFLTYPQALATLNMDTMVRVVSVWRVVPNRLGRSRQALGRVAISDAELARRLTTQGTDPDPPKPRPIPDCGPNCNCGSSENETLGCIHCCWIP